MSRIFDAIVNQDRKLLKRLLPTATEDEINYQNQSGTSPLYVASFNGNTRFVDLLLRAGAEPNLALNNGTTPLFIASHNGHVGVVDLLLRAGVEPNLARNNGTTPLFIASQNGQVGVVELLLSSGADPNLARNNGWTPLTVASHMHHNRIVDLLLEWGAIPPYHPIPIPRSNVYYNDLQFNRARTLRDLMEDYGAENTPSLYDRQLMSRIFSYLPRR